MERMDYSNISREDIEAGLKAFWDKKIERGEKIPYVKQLSNGQWEICTGADTFWCDSAGKEMFDEALEKAILNKNI